MTHAPSSTYRIQLHAGFTFADAIEIVPYLAKLGVSHVYCSPYLQAAKGSTHGYDVVDHAKLNPELGPERFEEFLATLKKHGLSHIVDIVPNHMGVATNDNAWWNDVLARGPRSAYARHFDIAWDAEDELRGKVFLPVLGGELDDLLASGDVRVTLEGGKLQVAYGERRFPLSEESIESLRSDAGVGANSLESLVEELNASPATGLRQLLDRQHYRLAHFSTAADDINYRRFFDVAELAALAMERPEVFEPAHRLIFDLVRRGDLTGLRIDHPDGLFGPKQYLQRLQEHAGDRAPLYVVVEKILAGDEALRTDWPCAGTTGYEFLIHTNALFVNSANADAFDAIYRDFTGERDSFDDVAHRAKCEIMDRSFRSELNQLTRRGERLARVLKEPLKVSQSALHDVIREVIACFDVYRTYATEAGLANEDRERIRSAFERARVRRPDLDESCLRFLSAALQLALPIDASHRDELLQFVGRFQQLTGPVMAKGVEDTAFYRYNRLLSLNEVGGEPGRFGISASELHLFYAERQRHWPFAMNTLSTHDTKRSEDVRARLNVLSEIPNEWGEALRSFRERTAPFRDGIHPNDEYMLYQLLIGAWPSGGADESFASRIDAVLQKSLREGKVRSNWITPDEAYEKRVQQFARTLMLDWAGQTFRERFEPLHKRIALVGRVNSMAQTMLKLTAPGVPDTYQGCEVLDFSLVDPDNRRPVDYAARQSLLDARDGAQTLDDAGKLWLTRSALHVRRAHPQLFTTGEYVPLEVAGAASSSVFAFARRSGSVSAVVVVPRLVAKLVDDTGRVNWADTRVRLPGDLGRTAWRDVLGRHELHPRNELHMGDADGLLPVRLLVSVEG
ncbi:MAG: malto-oligosyltrehalose synthase [Tepidisphaeraceae bacterium]